MNTSVSSVHVVPSIANEASGPSYSVVRLCETLNMVGNEANLSVLEPLPFGIERDFIKSFPYGLGPRRLGNSPYMKSWLRKQATSGAVAIMHNHSLWMLPNIYPAHAVRGTSCKLVVSPRGTMSDWAWCHSANIKRVFWFLLQKKALEDAAGFVATAQSEYADIRNRGFRQPVAVIPNGIDIPDSKIKVNAAEDGPRKLLFLSRIHPKKGIENLLRAWGVIEEHHLDWQLNIAGPDNGGYLCEMERLANNLSLKRCHFVGPLYGEKKINAYAGAELYILPTHSENFGMTVAEALASGTPAIVTKGAPWEGLEKEKAGWWIDIGIEPLIEALDDALGRSQQELAAMGENGRNWMIRDYSWEKIARDMALFYSWLVEGGETPGFVFID